MQSAQGNTCNGVPRTAIMKAAIIDLGCPGSSQGFRVPAWMIVAMSGSGFP